MPRLAALLLCSVVAFAVTAALAPVYKPERDRWLGLAGWDRPALPKGECNFVRNRHRLTVSIPDSTQAGRYYLQRDVEGDFVLQVRVSEVAREREKADYRMAGIFLTDGVTLVTVRRFAPRNMATLVLFDVAGKGDGRGSLSHCSGKLVPTYLRISRRSNEVVAESTADGKSWVEVNSGLTTLDLPRRVKVGVSAEVTLPTGLEAIFDEFKLTQPKK